MTPPETPPSDALAALRAALGSHYTIERLLGQGGMGAVYLARDITLDRPVAIKVINPEVASNPTLRDRFLQEARTVAKLRQPNIVPVFAAGETNGTLYFVMEYVPGESLRDILAREGKITGERAERILREIALALHHAHAQGMVHRDVKPENILIDAESGRAMLTDFGVARAFEKDGGLTQTGMILGSPRYMSPEQASGDRAIDGRSDLYSLALTGYELYAGAPVVQSGTAAAMLVKHLTETPAPLADKSGEVPAHVASAIDHGLQKDPDKRWQTGREFAEAIAGHALTPTSEIRGAGAASARRRRMLRVAAAGAVGVAIVASVWRFGTEPAGTAYLVAPFEIQSGDQSVAWLREGSVNMLTMTLGQWTDLHVVDYERTLSLLDKEDLGAKRLLSLDDALRLARHANAGTVVTGQVQTTRDSLLVIAKLYDVRSKEVQNQAQEGGALGADPRPVFDRLAQKLLQIAGGPASGVALTQATTTSIEAYRAYLDGVKFLNSWQLVEADSAFARAIELDSTFALAYHKRSLGLGWGDAGGANPADKALALSSRLPPREKALVLGHYHLVHALASASAGDTARARESYALSVKAYDDLLARGDSLFPEVWHGRADAYHHRRTNSTPPALLKAWTNESLRGFSRTLAIDSSFHLAYAHLVELYSASSAGSLLIISGDSTIFLDSATAARIGRDGVQRLRDAARVHGIEIAKAWARSDSRSARPFLQLATSYASVRQYDSAIVTLNDALRVPRSGGPGIRMALLTVQTAIGDTAAAGTLRYVLDRFTRDSLRQVTIGQRFAAEGDLLAAAAVAGSSADLERAAELFYATDSVVPSTATSSRYVIEFYKRAMRLAMGEPLTDGARRALLANVRSIDTTPPPVGTQARAQSVGVPYLAYLVSRDTNFRAAARRWGSQDFPELDAIAALSRGDTAAALTMAQTFTKPDSLRNPAVRFGLGGLRTIARAEVLAGVGLTRQAAETYEAMSVDRMQRAALAEPGYAVWVRTWLARARLWKQLNERDKAIAAYEEFIRRWTDADGIAAQQVAEARRELAEMRDAAKAR
jgi:tetratricopeptide (TPR) repeat protein/predicted Ser/Thr protein kinase